MCLDGFHSTVNRHIPGVGILGVGIKVSVLFQTQLIQTGSSGNTVSTGALGSEKSNAGEYRKMEGKRKTTNV